MVLVTTATAGATLLINERKDVIDYTVPNTARTESKVSPKSTSELFFSLFNLFSYSVGSINSSSPTNMNGNPY